MKKLTAKYALTALPLLTMVASCARAQTPAPQPKKPNVLFIAVDDLRPQLGAYGVADIQTPNMDALAQSGLLFNRAYCAVATCGPSRAALLTGRRPDTTRVYDMATHFRDTLPDIVALPQQFRLNGYFTQSLGKIYHGGLDDEPSWSAPSLFQRAGGGVPAGAQGEFPAPVEKTAAKPGVGADEDEGGGGDKPSWAALDVDDDALVDGKVAGAAIQVMREHKDEPFFLAVGFRKPHLPFAAPKKYFDLYPLEKMKLAPNPFPPTNVPALAMTNSGELRAYSDIPNGDAPISDAKARELVRGYYAATSFADAQVGRVLDELDRLDLRKNTIVILWGDHGWQLGEHTLWEKHTNFELATRAPLLLSVPGQSTRGQKTEALVEFVDIYPTLLELAGLPQTAGLEGRSFAPLLQNPAQTWKTAAFSQYPRGGGRQGARTMGYTMRSDRYRYTEWIADDKSVSARELYDHQTDPQENHNVAGAAANGATIAGLSRELHAAFPAIEAPGPLPQPLKRRGRGQNAGGQNAGGQNAGGQKANGQKAGKRKRANNQQNARKLTAPVAP